MVAERNSKPAFPEAMAATRSDGLRQPTLAEELAEAEAQRVVTGALQAKVEHHSMEESPKGQKPLTSTSARVTVTPTRTQKKVKTPSHVKTFPDGSTWTIEDGASSEEEEQVPEDDGGRQSDKTSQIRKEILFL